ncbi:transcription initiation factor TFIID subunit 1-like [Schistocerca gregaria]|uniref:transcription initiation factor TFIID subunit 1-like n=1 Tax=Schistocerca gregaria TaxID=7010 RepID=UPI00211DEAFD|nr:transcription initiation factor TFIID subunit 1-like [Schistocerca gregaria]XP_049851286.1 transcription initiation factor TFIID subunit 1-like [Schistocerca gregaria]
MVTLDDVCTYESQLVTAHRLQELGINSTHSIGTPFHRAVLALTDPYRAKIARFIGIELELTSWNLTSNFIKAKFQQGLLQLTGLGTATSTHDSYSYLRRPMKVANLKAEKEKEAKTQVTGTDRDLRKLDLPGLKAILKSYGMKDEEIDALPRWDQVDKVRSFANQSKAIDEDVEDDKHKFARGSRHNVATHQELYDATCQTIFNNQVKELSNTVPPELDEEDSSDLAEMIGLDIDDDAKHTSGKKTSQQQEEDEERLYQEFVKSLETKAQTDEDAAQSQSNTPNPQLSDPTCTEFKDDNALSSKYSSILDDPNFVPVPLHPVMRIPLKPGLYIKVTRTSLDGYEECQWSDNPVLIEAAKRKDKKPSFLVQSSFQKRLLAKPLSETEERERANKKREKRKLQERLRRQKNHAKRQFQLQQVMLGKVNAAVPKSNNKLRCGRCGMIGHMRTNRDCPFYTEEDAYLYSLPTKLRRTKGRRYESDDEDLYDSEEYETPVDEFDNYDARGLPEPSSNVNDQGLDDDKMNDEEIDYVQNGTQDIDQIQSSDQQEAGTSAPPQGDAELPHITGLPSSSLDQPSQENVSDGSQKTQEESIQVCDNHAASGANFANTNLSSAASQQEKFVVKLRAHDRPPASSFTSTTSSDTRIRHSGSYPIKKRKSINSDDVDLMSDDDAELTELDVDEYDDDSSEFFASRTSRRSAYPKRGGTLSSTPSQDRSSKTNRSNSSGVNSAQLCQALKQIFDPIYSNFVYEAFKHKVNTRDFPDYPLVVKRPMHMDAIQNKLRKGAYRSVQEFIADWELIKANCIAYNQNTPNQDLIGYAQALVSEVKNAICAQSSTFHALDSLYTPPDVTSTNSNNLSSYESQTNFVS